jgi:8-oxo-dGTP pyrophosphatase MutT (NUDIX family)
MESKDTSNLYNIENAFCLLMDNEIDDNNQLNDEILSDKYNDELTNDESNDESNDDSNEDELPNEENLNDYESDQDIVVLSNYNGKTYFQEKIKIDKKQTWKKKDNLYCNNCGKYGHTYRRCYEPITSYGIICLNLNNYNLNTQNKNMYDFFVSKYKFPENSQLLKNICVNKYIQKNISCNNRKDLDLYDNKVSKNIELLMVRRKQTYNYIHLIRGIYELEIENIIRSINLLTNTEYTKLTTNTFDELWEDIWGSNAFKPEFIYDYLKAKEQFHFFKEYLLPQINYRINITYKVPEWGFPKGKRNNLESNFDCAKREFEEETGLNESNYELLDRLYPLVENIKGSNGINYKHVYYVALLKNTPKIPNIKIGNNSNQNFEIGDIGSFNIDHTLHILRDYNIERKEIINILKLFFTYNTRYFERFYHEKS